MAKARKPANDPPHVPARVFGIIAREADVAVLFRRGPSKWVQLLRWDTKHDTFEPGQWFHGRIYERRSDLSPDGSLLIYFAQKMTDRTIKDRAYTYAWTAVSRPPYLTALALWPKGNCWHGGGLFDSDRHVMLNHREVRAHPNHRPRSQSLKVTPNPRAYGEDLPVLYARLTRDGWVRTGAEVLSEEREERTFEKPRARGVALVMKSIGTSEIPRRPGRGVYYEEYAMRLRDGGSPAPLPEVEWADFDQRGRLVFARGGCVYAGKISSDGGITDKLLIDLNDAEPSAVAAPAWATKW